MTSSVVLVFTIKNMLLDHELPKGHDTCMIFVLLIFMKVFVLVLLSAHTKILVVSCMQDFLLKSVLTGYLKNIRFEKEQKKYQHLHQF